MYIHFLYILVGVAFELIYIYLFLSIVFNDLYSFAKLKGYIQRILVKKNAGNILRMFKSDKNLAHIHNPVLVV